MHAKPDLPAQIPSGAWRDHLPYNKAKRLTEAGGRIFCSTLDGSLFSLDKKDYTIQKYSKVNGLSDSDISTINATNDLAGLIIGYSNGNIDFIINDSIINIPDIKNKLIVGDKTINTIMVLGTHAYLACGFGIVVLDLAGREIRDTYMFGEGGGQIYVNDLGFDGTYIYAATETGIFRADINSPNLVDYHFWSGITGLPDVNAPYKFIVPFADRLFTVYRNDLTGFDDIIFSDGENWQKWEESGDDQVYQYLGAHSDRLVTCSYLRTRVYDQNAVFQREAVTYYARHAIVDSDEVLWYADPEAGLVRIDNNGNGYVISPPGPAYRTAGDLETAGGTLWAGGGNEASRWAGYGAYLFTNEKWINYNEKTQPALLGFLNISEIAIDPFNEGHVIGGSLGYGLAEFIDGELVDIIDENDGVLKTVSGYGHGYLLVKGVDFDKEGSLWVATTFSDNPVYKRKISGEWQVPDFSYAGFGINTRISDVLPAEDGKIWLLIEREGLLVFTEDDGRIDSERFFTVQNQAGNVLEWVYCITGDKDNNIWVGTNKGPVVYSGNTDFFSGNPVIAYQPQIPRNDGSHLVDLLLSTEKINDICVDGANQKWIATEKSGVYLVTPDGEKELKHFNTLNSPLFSDNVQSIAVNEKTGEVFFATDKGILSYRGQVTEGTDDFSEAYVFPNPVREDYSGDITITGLVSDVDVKITDISGNLVYASKAGGGQVIWDGLDFQGRRVSTGVYLVFFSTPDGTKTHVLKLLFIN